MPRHRKMMVSGDHIGPFDKGPPWCVLWDTTARTEGEWSIADAQSEATALERAAHFLRLGFAVHAIKDPSGIVVMDASAIVDRLHPTADEPVPPAHQRLSDTPERPSAEQSGRQLLRTFVDGYKATPGRMLAAVSLSALLLEHGMRPPEFERAVRYAKSHDWLIVADGTLTLTPVGYAIARARPHEPGHVPGAVESL
jgi:hypothetical protein